MWHIITIAVAFFVLLIVGLTVYEHKKYVKRIQAIQQDPQRSTVNDLFMEPYLDNIGALRLRSGNVDNYAEQMRADYLRYEHRDAMARIYNDALQLRMPPKRRVPKKRNLPEWW
jgi:hypothetical protein